MPREIKTTLAVDGEAAFKRAINDANTSIRNMGTQLTLATAQFKKDGDAMKLMETRSKTLKSEIEQQEEIVKALEKAVKDSSTAYGENSDKTEKWEAELNRAKTRLVNLQSELTLNNAGLDRNGKAFDDSSEKAADYQATLQTIGKGVSFENITNGISKITSGFESAVRKIFNFAKAMRDTMVDAGHWADDLMTDATKYNMDVEELQRWRNAADFIDTDVETIVNARNKLAQKMNNGWTKTEGKNKIDLWELYGIKVQDGDTGKFRSEMDVLFDVGELLMSIAKNDDAGGEVRADAVAMELFGKSYRDLLPLFSAGRDEWEKTLAEQHVVSEEHVKALAEMDDANNQLKNSWETLKYTALAEVAPVLTDATNALSSLLNEFNDWLETDEGKEAMSELAEALRELFSGLGDIKFTDAITAAKDGLNALKDALTWIKDHKNDVENALKIIAGGFAAIKVAELALNIGKIVSGFQTLWAGAKNPMPSLPGGGTSGNGGTGDVTGGGGGATAGWIGAAKATMIDLLPTIGGQLAVVAAAVTPAVLAQLGTERRITSDYEHAEEVATAAEEANASKEDVELLRQLNDAVGPKRTEDGGYKRNALGFLDLNPTAQAEYILQSLGDVRKRGQLYSDIMTYGDENDNVNGWRPWSMMSRYWGEYRDEYGNRDDTPLDQNDINAMVEYLREIQIQKLENQSQSGTESMTSGTSLDAAVSDIKANTEATKAVADRVAGADFKRFNGLPGEMQAAVQRGAASGVSGIIVRLDGATVGRLVAPYVNAYLGSAMG